MKTAVETVNPTRVKLTVEVPFEELKPSVDEAYKKIAGQVQLPGFRKGKVPPRLIDQRFGRGMVLEEAVNDALPRFYGQAVRENDVQALGQPEVDVTEVPDPQQGGDLKFTAEARDPDRAVSRDRQTRLSLVWEYTPLPFVQLRAGVRNRDDVQEVAALNQREVFLQLHGYL